MTTCTSIYVVLAFGVAIVSSNCNVFYKSKGCIICVVFKPVTITEAESKCKEQPGIFNAVGLASNDINHFNNFAVLTRQHSCKGCEYHSNLRYELNGDAVYLGNFSIDKSRYTWSQGHPPSNDVPCLSARGDGIDHLNLTEVDCTAKLNFSCISINEIKAKVCNTDQTQVPSYGLSCDVTCENSTTRPQPEEATSTTAPYTSTTTSTKRVTVTNITITGPPDFKTFSSAGIAGIACAVGIALAIIAFVAVWYRHRQSTQTPPSRQPAVNDDEQLDTNSVSTKRLPEAYDGYKAYGVH